MYKVYDLGLTVGLLCDPVVPPSGQNQLSWLECVWFKTGFTLNHQLKWTTHLINVMLSIG